MHPTTLGPTNRLISPDWPGHLKRTVESLTGATCLFAQGATGNVGPGPDGFTDDVGVVRRLGAMVGCEAARVFLGLDLPAVRHRHERVWESGAPLGKWARQPLPETEPVVRVLSRDIALPLIAQPPLAEARARVDEAQSRLDDLKGRGAPAAEIEAATFATKRANMTLSRAETYGGKEEFPVELHLLQIGPAVFVGRRGRAVRRDRAGDQGGLAVPGDLVRGLHRRLGRLHPDRRRLSSGRVRGRHLALCPGGGRAVGREDARRVGWSASRCRWMTGSWRPTRTFRRGWPPS